MAYAPEVGAVVLFGGRLGTASSGLGDAYAFAGGAWTALPTAGSPPARWGAAAAPDGAGNVPVLVGGQGGSGALADAWALVVPPAVAVGALPASVEASAPVNLTVTPTGGMAPYALHVDFGDNQSATATSGGAPVTIEHAFSAEGPRTVTATRTDVLGLTASATATTTVAVGPTVAITASPPVGDVALPVRFNATASANGSIAWQFGDGSNGTGAATSHAYQTTGTFTVTAVFTDAGGAVATASLSLPVAPPMDLHLWVPPGGLSGAPVGVYANVTGGSCPCAYAWTFGDGASGSFPTPQHTYAAAGTFPVQVRVTDAAGATASAGETLEITAAPGPTPSGTATAPVPPWFWPAVAVLGAVGVVGAILLLRRGRRPPV
jgi:PKD repeat protein